MKCFFCNREMSEFTAILRGRCSECGKDYHDLTIAVERMVNDLQKLADDLDEDKYVGNIGDVGGDIIAILDSRTARDVQKES